MALSTTQSIWRSGGGDNTRTAYCGSGLMAATFYIADVAAASSTNVVVSSASGAPALILPAGARIMSITFTGDAATGQTDMGFTLYTTGTNTGAGLLDNASNVVGTITPGASGSGTSLGTVMSATELVYITARVGGSAGTGNMSGVIQYFVTDPLVGQQNV
jgi:hypothetical protein